ncbi:DUF393 domain-containing protein [Radiobacillus kanasensis]|uniref:thiol-disulfide oxidoreductase DCC family protein n=1 Tax=Radiobacillus kanasensis TaxID=2844358 RepID=UPI001E3A3205|nr:DUF393 domain-containing protein [Radiobacillus kanasensis]UFT98169.1 DUF393 domain-containing protein [Radiobacillus kanasensis]
MGKTAVLYDRDCYLCNQTKRIVNKLDWFRRFQWISFQAYQQEHTLSEEEKRKLAGELHILTDKGETYSGYFAIRYMLLQCPLTFLLGACMSIPGAKYVGIPVYRWIARNRYRLFKSKCENGVCKIPS